MWIAGSDSKIMLLFKLIFKVEGNTLGTHTHLMVFCHTNNFFWLYLINTFQQYTTATFSCNFHCYVYINSIAHIKESQLLLLKQFIRLWLTWNAINRLIHAWYYFLTLTLAACQYPDEWFYSSSTSLTTICLIVKLNFTHSSTVTQLFSVLFCNACVVVLAMKKNTSYQMPISRWLVAISLIAVTTDAKPHYLPWVWNAAVIQSYENDHCNTFNRTVN